MTTHHGRIDAVDGMRALAALMVYSYHSWEFCGAPVLGIPWFGGQLPLGPLFEHGLYGVNLFMVLSGFCLFWPLAKKPEAAAGWSWRNYAERRVWRIMPAYYASIAFVTLLPNALVILFRALGQPAKWQGFPEPWQYFTHLLFIQTWFPSTWDGIQGTYWSLGLEAQFYLVFPFVVLAFRRWGIRVAWLMIAASVIFRIIVNHFTVGQPWPVEFLWSITFLGRWNEFALGMLAAWTVARLNRTAPLGGWAGAALAALAVGCWFGAAFGKPFSTASVFPISDLLLAAGSALGLIALCGSRFLGRKVFEWKPVTWIGGISYSLFLIHQNLAFYVSELLKKVLHLQGALELAVMLTFVLAGVVAASAIFAELFEKPFLKGKPAQPVWWMRCVGVRARPPAPQMEAKLSDP